MRRRKETGDEEAIVAPEKLKVVMLDLIISGKKSLGVEAKSVGKGLKGGAAGAVNVEERTVAVVEVNGRRKIAEADMRKNRGQDHGRGTENLDTSN